MNNPKTMVLGWGSLVVGAGVSFYYAKKSINERRRQQDVDGSRPTAKLSWKERVALEEQSTGVIAGNSEKAAKISTQDAASSSSTSAKEAKDDHS
ncbi:hypothetical protein HETIRDRAFT_148735 [Heterobasidion irregulare TC 32-1]|uniref:Uncharacterized protein n=1 Tax=Heterobasidion irregulare (strain TC 32-1) TaxID=747525 RepID=W4JY41_HETIT|nr:uncharacterized protein HETIRDRAFT_148735 [Heterobasidion irregulare TC 32-1]ETW78020.1 hypothetical protein HETIRDRAFT_148735 [Heterobasidion irregulare TC 32-1]